MALTIQFSKFKGNLPVNKKKPPVFRRFSGFGDNPTGCGLIKKGSKGNCVEMLQNMLSTIMNVPVVSSWRIGTMQAGNFDYTTEQTVKTFQGRYGLVVDGLVGDNTWKRLVDVISGTSGVTTTPAQPTPITVNTTGCGLVKRGSTGNCVSMLQSMLNNIGYNLKVDGVFGTNTHSAVVDFQRKRRLIIDAQVGDKTWAELVNAISKSVPQPLPDIKPEPTVVYPEPIVKEGINWVTMGIVGVIAVGIGIVATMQTDRKSRYV